MDDIARNWRKAELNDRDRALCAHADKLTRAPQAMGPADVDALRNVGLDDRAIHDATQVIGFFNYINRLADALGVEPEAFTRRWGETDGPT